jgi:hypothetical protein
MDSFAAFVVFWFASTLATLVVGLLHGRANDALTLGVLLGPVGLLLAIRWLPRRRCDVAKAPVAVAVRRADRPRRTARAAAASKTPLRRSA